jgi:hypothetical protein
MHCANCGDEILEAATRYEEVTPVEGGGQTMEQYCCIACLNEDVGFSGEEIEKIIRQSQYELPTETDFEWAGFVEPQLDSLHRRKDSMGEFYLLFEHVEKDYDVEIFYEAPEELYEVVLYTYDVDDGQKIGLENVRKEYTGVMQRALAYAEEMMESVQEYEA